MEAVFGPVDQLVVPRFYVGIELLEVLTCAIDGKLA